MSSLILTAHGTRRAAGVVMIGDLAARVSELLGRIVQVAFVDVLGPTPSEVLSNLPNGRGDCPPAVMLPAFLSRGYHVRADLPTHIAASGYSNVITTPALGPGPEVTRILGQRLVESGWRDSDSVILAAAGTSDRQARADLHNAAALLSALIGSRVDLCFIAVGTHTGIPDARDAVIDARRQGARRVVIASYLLADGLFHQRLRGCGADLVTQPLGTHPGMVRLVASRFRRAAHTPRPAIKKFCRQGTPTSAALDLW